MKALKARFNGNSQEVVDYAKEFGILPAMQNYDVKDYVAMCKFLEEVEPEYKFVPGKRNPDAFSQPNAFDNLLESILRKYDQLNAKVADLESQNAELTKKLNYYKAAKWQETSGTLQAVLKECEG